MTPSPRSPAARRLCAALLLPWLLLAPAACDDGATKPNESNTYNVHLYYGKDVSEYKYLGKAQGISQCKTKVHAEAAKMQLKGNTYKYTCCWLYQGEPCHERHQ